MTAKMYWFDVTCRCGCRFPFGTSHKDEVESIVSGEHPLVCIKCGNNTTTARLARAPVKSKRRPARSSEAPCPCPVCQGVVSEGNMQAIELLIHACKSGKLMITRCNERVTGNKIVVVGAAVAGKRTGFVPLARLFQDEATLEVEPPEGFIDPLGHRGQA